MNFLDNTVITIKTESDVLHARRISREFGKRFKIGEHMEVRLATIVSELSRNILKYAGAGSCELVFLGDRGVRCVFRDQGPGIDDLDAALTDGYSTFGTLGIGLPGAKRLADKFEIQSDSSGTIVSVELKPLGAPENGLEELDQARPSDSIRCGIAIRPLDWGRYSGDQAGVWYRKRNVVVCIADGLGHGEPAERAARKAIDTVAADQELGLADMMRECDKALKGSRGAAMALARIDLGSGDLEYVSIGNTRCAIVGQSILHLGGSYGIVGEGAKPASFERRTLQRRDVLIFWTDGLPETLGLVAPQVRRITDAQLFAERLIKEHAIDSDDAGVVVFRWDI